MSLTAQQILSKKCKIKEIELESGETIFVKEFTTGAMSKFSEADPIEGIIITIILGVCDENGKRIFKDEDSEQLCELPNATLLEMSQAVMRFNGMMDEKEAAKNS